MKRDILDEALRDALEVIYGSENVTEQQWLDALRTVDEWRGALAEKTVQDEKESTNGE